MNFLAAAQERNEAACGAMLEYAAKTREQSFATAGQLVDLMAAQSNAITEAAKANEKAMEKAMRDSSEAAVKTAEKIARNQKSG